MWTYAIKPYEIWKYKVKLTQLISYYTQSILSGYRVKTTYYYLFG